MSRFVVAAGFVPLAVVGGSCSVMGLFEEEPRRCTPSGEVCDGIDNDCDGETDEGLGAQPERCNGTDDDCDGDTDEDFDCVRETLVGACMTPCGSTGTGTCTSECRLPDPAACTPPAETCNGADDDCDGDTDEGFACPAGSTTDCDTTCRTRGSGTCTPSCERPTGVACTPPAEACNALDDDCDTETDEGFECTAGSTVDCDTTCGGDPGTGTCTGACRRPVPTACLPPTEERCNGVDDDCDGDHDEGYPCTAAMTYPCTSACGTHGTSVCDSTCTPGACAPPLESCANGIDDDCDTTTDEPPCCPVEMVVVPAGPFVRGSDSSDPDSEADERPEHQLRVELFCLDKLEVTNADYRACVSSSICTEPAYGYVGGDLHPVGGLTWSQASAYCAARGKRLPTEAEWEKAARGGCEIVPPAGCGPEDERTYPWGDDPPPAPDGDCRRAVWNLCPDSASAEVGGRPDGASPYGALDLAGNVAEWVSDYYQPDYYATCASGSCSVMGPADGTTRVVRGGDYLSYRAQLRVADRLGLDPDTENVRNGVRCALTP